MVRNLVTSSEQILRREESIACSLTLIEQAKLLLKSADDSEVKRGRRMISLNHHLTTPYSYVIGQIKWRLRLDDPRDDLERAVHYFALALRECGKAGIEFDTYWAHLVAFLTVLLSGAVPDWVADRQADVSLYAHRKARLKPWEINLGYQSALAIALYERRLPECWERFITESKGRAGMKRIHATIVSYDRLFNAAKNRAWDDLVDALIQVDSNYRSRATSEASYADVFGEGPYNSQSVDYIAAAILRTVQSEPQFPAHRIDTPHFWSWDDRSLSHISPSAEA